MLPAFIVNHDTQSSPTEHISSARVLKRVFADTDAIKRDANLLGPLDVRNFDRDSARTWSRRF